MHNEDETGFPKLSAPARRALSGAGYTRLDQLATVTEPDLARLHGIGLTTIASLRQALHERGLAFRSPSSASEHRVQAGSAVATVEEYLRGLEDPKRGTLEALRQTILEVVPEAEQVISYGLPAFRVDGQIVAGFAAFKNHLSYLPFSGSVLEQLGDELNGYTMTKSALHFPVDRPLSKPLVQRLIALRLADRGGRIGGGRTVPNRARQRD